MRRNILTAVLAVVAASAFGQSAVNMNTAVANAAIRAVYKDAASLGFADGTAVAAGVKVGLYAGATQDSLKLYGALANFATTPAAANGFINSGSGGGTRQLSDLPPGTPAYFQLRAWSTGYNNYEDAFASGLNTVVAGKGPIVSATPASLTGSPPPTPTQILWQPGTTTAAPGFWYVTPVPEPSTVLLGLIGLAGMYLIRRRK